MSLQSQLDSLTAKLRAMVPAERLAVVDVAAEELIHSGQADRALKAGDLAPIFELPDGDGMLWRSEDLLRNGPLIIVFYRGRWCAYCNAQLAALQEIHPQIAEAGASLVAISPQTQKHSYMTRDMHKLRFPVLSDQENQVARKFGLVYRLSPELQAMYESIMTKLPGYNGDQSWELPLAATYVVQPDGKIFWTRIDADWRHRPEPEEILQVVTDSVRTNRTR
ncbi:MAG TPA: peroxiredoxin-like family protein [Candidatus Angelobacter sp.]|nr:peroxiredoxin-like family protein [Candidatus Angelobacter sp.]